MIRLFFDRGPYDGGQMDFDPPEQKSRKGHARGEVVLPSLAFVSHDGATYAWLYRLTRVITPYSGTYTLFSWVRLHVVRDSPLIILGTSKRA